MFKAVRNEETTFSTEDTSDLPAALRKELNKTRGPRKSRFDAMVSHVVHSAGRPLTKDEVLVGLYRMYGEAMKKSSLTTVLKRLIADRAVKNVGRGIYAA